jgi:hypothetical protein
VTEARLKTINALRWIRENLWVWGLLATIYSYTVALVLESVLELASGVDLSWGILWPVTWGALFLPWILHRLPMGSLSIQVPHVARIPFVGLYLRHELRRTQSYISVAVSLVLLLSLPPEWMPLALIVSLIPSQQGLYSIQDWRVLALASNPQHGARWLLVAFGACQLILGSLVLLGWVIWAFLFSREHLVEILRWIPPFYAGWLASSCAALEGDAGRRWIVNFVGLAAGLIGAFVASYHPLLLILVAYFSLQMVNSVKERLKSVELMDEDTLIS